MEVRGFRLVVTLLMAAMVTAQDQDCPAENVSFEVITGFVYTAPADMLDSQPGTLILNDCIETCRQNSSCKSINFETGLCVLFSSSADENKSQLTKSQYPVFTIYVQKNCLPSAASCDAAWSFERVMDHSLDTELLLIDERGCPTDASIMGEVYHAESSDKLSYSDFDAFRFPTSDVVQFRAMITPCLPKCEPVKCDVLDYTGQTKAVDSFGRKKRSLERTRRSSNPEELLVVQSLKIVDRYGKREKHQLPQLPGNVEKDVSSIKEDIIDDAHNIIYETDCLDKSSMITGAVIFLAAQLIIVILFALIWRRNQRNSDKGLSMMESPTGSVVSSRADSLSYMYDSGFARRLK